MLHIDVNFANRLSPYLRNFKKRGDYSWNFSCPICGDSNKNKSKARGHIYKIKNFLSVKCFNCAYSANIGTFIKTVQPVLYNEYVLERYKNTSTIQVVHSDIKHVIKEPIEVLSNLKSLSELKEIHPAVQYIKNRKVPKDKWNLFYFTSKYKEWTNSIKYTFKNLEDDHPRLVIPFFDINKNVFMYSARAFGKEDPKYYHIKIDEDYEKIYGLDRVDLNKTIYVTEGQIDSLFIDNCISVSGGSFDTPFVRSNKYNIVIIPDNERRSIQTCSMISKCIESGLRVFLWPDTLIEKDINDLIKNGRNTQFIMDMINDNTFSGIEAKLKFQSWTKTNKANHAIYKSNTNN